MGLVSTKEMFKKPMKAVMLSVLLMSITWKSFRQSLKQQMN
jgi:hypothetical protein